jgi:hypothetical protein
MSSSSFFTLSANAVVLSERQSQQFTGWLVQCRIMADEEVDMTC